MGSTGSSSPRSTASRSAGASAFAGRAYVPFLFVTPLLQNQGVGTALLQRMESLLELEGADRIQLDTLADNVRAVNFTSTRATRSSRSNRTASTAARRR